jgi:hypothetical protein
MWFVAMWPKEFAFADGELAEAINLPPREGGWGLLFCLDDRELRYTLACDPDYLRVMLDIPPDAEPGTVPPRANRELGFDELPAEAFPLRKRGWPDMWSRKEQRARFEVLAGAPDPYGP